MFRLLFASVKMCDTDGLLSRVVSFLVNIFLTGLRYRKSCPRNERAEPDAGRFFPEIMATAPGRISPTDAPRSSETG
ncbi:hypothetical protein DPEC_G00374980 [Dallia pectoralis]|nr:hypothetical protein DPEC_G00374980 [Dallia pectoralis]